MEGYLVQCKSTSRQSGIGIEGINEVVGGAAHYRVKEPNVRFKLAVATNASFNRTATENSNNQLESVKLWSFSEISEQLLQYEVYVD